MNKAKIGFVLGFICMLLVIGICIQVKTVKSTSIGIGKTQTENELRNQVLKLQEKYKSLYNKQLQREKELENLRTEVSNSDTESSNFSEKLEKYNTLLGYTEVSGQGIIITVKDANATNIIGNATDFVVHDGDLLEIVNALRNAGAEAISINEQRIVNTTAITCAGNIIKINGEKQGSPFIIKAIGLTEKLNGALTMPGGYLELLKRDGVQVKIEESNNIAIPKYEGVYRFQYAENI